MSHKPAIRLFAFAGAVGAMLSASALDAAILRAPVAPRAAPDVQPAGEVCGPGRKSGPNGVCVAYSWVAPSETCPAGTHAAPDGASCWPN